MRVHFSSRIRHASTTFRRAKRVNWSDTTTALDATDTCHLPINMWSTLIHSTICRHSKEIARTEDRPHVDSHFLSSRDNRCTLFKWWRLNKSNVSPLKNRSTRAGMPGIRRKTGHRALAWLLQCHEWPSSHLPCLQRTSLHT